jgi:hypothetical protein
MSRKLTAVLAPAVALGLLAASAQAQQHKATRLGNPATRFTRALKKPDDVRVLVRGDKTKADVAAILEEVGWKGNLEDLDRAAAAADISVAAIPPGTRIPFMASRKNRKPHALMDVLWAGRKPIEAFTFEFSSSCERYRFQVPHACGNFWIEDLGKDTTDPKCAPPPPPPVVSVQAAPDACVTQPVEISIDVKNPPADGKVDVAVNGKQLLSGTLSAGSFRTTFPGARQPGAYEVTATSGGVSGTATVNVRPCVPTCGITVTPLPVQAGKPFTVDLSGSRVAAGVQGGIHSAKVEVLDAKGQVVDTVQMASGSLTRTDVVIKKGGKHTLRAVVTDEADETSTNACQADVDVKSAFPFFAGAYFGKERFTHDEASDHTDIDPFTPFSRCSPEIGFQVGVQPKIGEKGEFEAAVGLKVPFDSDAHTTMFVDAAVNRVLSGGFFGAGLSWFDIGKDSGGIGLLIQGGFDLTKDGKWQFVGQARAPFDQFDNLDNNYQFWGGFRFRPNSSK